MKTEAVLLLDKSGSMSIIKNDTIGSVENFVAEQKVLKDAGSLTLTIVEFDTETRERTPRTKIEDVGDTYLGYVPFGATALLDAIGETVNKTEEILKSKKKERNVVFVIITDGEENSSREYSSLAIKSLIERKQNEGWNFLFLGANQDAFSVGKDMGITLTSVSNYKATGKGIAQAASASSSFVAQTRMGKPTDNWRDGIED